MKMYFFLADFSAFEWVDCDYKYKNNIHIKSSVHCTTYTINVQFTVQQTYTFRVQFTV